MTRNLPEPLQKRVTELLLEPLETGQVLAEELDEYLVMARQHLPSGSRQLGLAESLATRLVELLHSQLEPEGRQLAQVALRYLVLDQDASPDFASEQGLDDDVQVFNAIAAQLGRSDLILGI
ncbi:hypothetical protein IV102_12290 [bacterium]|nr:hypothetical protein [bacterium]